MDVTALTPEQRDARLALDVERLLRFGRKHKLIKDLDEIVARNTLLDLLALPAPSEEKLPSRIQPSAEFSIPCEPNSNPTAKSSKMPGSALCKPRCKQRRGAGTAASAALVPTIWQEICAVGTRITGV